ncbi:DddA-like double-stranded DNA deaminase toxin [Saccharothrix lopnurensis]|uniref:DddA-like double-stranded DNA deaminase toxin n=1 Tax=Saccharothrix lopnurensis TaxID=1670621 RepID=A0ABW1P756_9PSEU
MASTREVAAQVRAACAKGAQGLAALEQAEDLAQEARDVVARAVEGARHLEAGGAQVLSAFAGVVDACKGHLWPLLNEAVKAAENCADHLAAEGTPDLDPAAQRPVRLRPTQPQQFSARQAEPDDPPVVPSERVEQLRRELSSPVVPNSGQKTHGRWIAPDGTVRAVRSGFDHDSALVQNQLARMGMPGGSGRSGDVEQKLAAHMVANGIKHATLVINHRPCRGRDDSCDTLVPILLPEGSTLTVHGQTAAGVRTRIRYTGGARPWWT